MLLFRPLTASNCNPSTVTEAVPPGVGVQPASAPATSTTGASATVPRRRRVVRDHLLARTSLRSATSVAGRSFSTQWPPSVTTSVRCSVMVGFLSPVSEREAYGWTVPPYGRVNPWGGSMGGAVSHRLVSRDRELLELTGA